VEILRQAGAAQHGIAGWNLSPDEEDRVLLALEQSNIASSVMISAGSLATAAATARLAVPTRTRPLVANASQRLPLPLSTREVLISNERVKVTTAWFDRASTLLLTVGVAQPVAQVIFDVGKIDWPHVISWFVWLTGAAVLHILARRMLRRLQT
jgi:hypothetical protein